MGFQTLKYLSYSRRLSDVIGIYKTGDTHACYAYNKHNMLNII